MPSDFGPAVLGFDTSGGWCAAALVRGGRVLVHRHQEMDRGQGEELLPLLGRLLAEAGLTWSDLAAIGVGTGPGNFTGTRIAVAAARGLALGLGIPAVGISRFEALALDGPALPVLVPAIRGMAWLGHDGAVPEAVDPAGLIAPVIADPVDFPGRTAVPPAHPLAVAIALLATARFATPQPRPAPLYLREADAAPPSEPPPVLIG